MSIRFATLLCLTGLAACTQENTPPAETAYSTSEPTPAATEPAMTPASLEDERRDSDAAVASKPIVPAPGDRGTNEQVTTNNPPVAANSPAAPAAAPDNTKVNERDRNDASLTPMDQKENQTDLKITQQIRQAVMADGSLSFTAKNVKIITQNGKVTLRGPVNTPQERSAIEAAARKVAGATQIDNQIEVKK